MAPLHDLSPDGLLPPEGRGPADVCPQPVAGLWSLPMHLLQRLRYNNIVMFGGDICPVTEAFLCNFLKGLDLAHLGFLNGHMSPLV